MSVFFRGEQLKLGDIHGAPEVLMPPHMTRRFFQFGQSNVLERSGGAGPRQIKLLGWLNDSSFVAASSVYQYLDLLDRRIGFHGSLIVNFDGDSVTYNNCTFDGARRIPQPGHELAAPLEDPVQASGLTPNSYWLEVMLMFTQIRW